MAYRRTDCFITRRTAMTTNARRPGHEVIGAPPPEQMPGRHGDVHVERESDLPFVPYPSGLRLEGRRVVVVGGGCVAQRRVEGLLVSGAEVVVVSPQAAPRIVELAENDRVTWLPRGFRPSDLNDTWYVVACADKSAVNELVGQCADERRIFCVRSDDGTAATAWTPAVGHHGDVTVAVLSNRHPRQSRSLRDQVIAHLVDGTIDAGPDGRSSSRDVS